MTEFTVQYPLEHLFKNISNGGTLINGKLSFKIEYNDVVVMNNIVFTRNKDIENLIVYESNDKNATISFDPKNMEIVGKYNTFSDKYIDACRRKYKQNNELKIRTDKINKEIERIQNLKILIKKEIIHNLNLTKKQKESHHVGSVKKLISHKYDKPIFIYDLEELTPTIRDRIINYINQLLEYEFLSKNDNLEKFYIGISFCNILKNINLYINYLNVCIEKINEDVFNLNKNLMFNDILNDRINEKDNVSYYSKIYEIIDYNVYGVDLHNKTIPTGYCLSLSNNNNKWNVYPLNNDKCNYVISDDNIQQLIDITKLYNDENICLLEQYIIN